MPTASLNLLVLKTNQLDRLRGFYQALGIEFAEERHGEGPLHYAGSAGGAILEIYPLPKSVPTPDATTRLGFRVDNLPEVISAVRGADGVIVREPEHTPHGFRAVVRDPDGRSVELCANA